MKVGVAAHGECCRDWAYSILPDEFCHDSMQVDFYKYIDVCVVARYLLDVQNLGGYISQFAACIPSYNLNYTIQNL